MGHAVITIALTHCDALHLCSKDFRAALTARGVATGRSVLHHAVTAPDGTKKFLLQLFDGRVVETVGIPVDDAGVQRLQWHAAPGAGPTTA